jgi:hypothetical protein
MDNILEHVPLANVVLCLWTGQKPENVGPSTGAASSIHMFASQTSSFSVVEFILYMYAYSEMHMQKVHNCKFLSSFWPYLVKSDFMILAFRELYLSRLGEVF